MASRFGVDVSNLDAAFSSYGRAVNLLAEQRRLEAEREAEREAQREQAKRVLIGSALGFAGGQFLGDGQGAAGLQFGAAAANLTGPRPNQGAAMQMGAGGIRSMQQQQIRNERSAALKEFEDAVHPQPINTAGGTTVTPPPNRRQAASAAIKLGDTGTAARLAFPAEGKPDQTPYEIRYKGDDGTIRTETVFGTGALNAALKTHPDAKAKKVGTTYGDQGKGEPSLYNVSVPDKDAEGGYAVESGLTLAEAQKRAKGQEGAVISKVGTALPERKAGSTKEPVLYDVVDSTGKKLVANAVPLSDAKTARAENEGSRIRKFDPKLGGEGEGKPLPAHMRVDLNDTFRQAVINTKDLESRDTMIDALARNKSPIEAMKEVGSLDRRKVEREYADALNREINSSKPPAEKDVARAELARLRQHQQKRDEAIKFTKEALSVAGNDPAKRAIALEWFKKNAVPLGADMGDIDQSAGLTVAR